MAKCVRITLHNKINVRKRNKSMENTNFTLGKFRNLPEVYLTEVTISLKYRINFIIIHSFCNCLHSFKMNNFHWMRCKLVLRWYVFFHIDLSDHILQSTFSAEMFYTVYESDIFSSNFNMTIVLNVLQNEFLLKKIRWRWSKMNIKNKIHMHTREVCHDKLCTLYHLKAE